MRFCHEKITEYREKEGITQNDLARKLGGSYQAQHIANWETGKMSPSVKSLKLLSDVTGIPLDSFFVENDYNSNKTESA